MKTLHLAAIGAAALATLATAGAFVGHGRDAESKLDAAGSLQLAQLRDQPGHAGERLYVGTVYAQPAGAEALYTYERRVQRAAGDGAAAATHVTRTPAGEVVIAERATFDADYRLRSFDTNNAQGHFSGQVRVSDDGRQLDYSVVRNGRHEQARETVTAPPVTGPSLHGFIARHRELLAQGGSLPVRMIVMPELRSYGFEIRRAGVTADTVAYTVTPSSWLVRLAIDPLVVTFDRETRNIVRYEGRVPPMRWDGARWRNLDARVEYALDVPVYR